MFIPEGCKTLKDASEPQRRIGIQGFPGSGKTWSAMTFQNPIVVSLDRGLGAHYGSEKIIEVPLWSEDYCKTVNPNHKDRSTLRNTLLLWLDKFSKKLEPDQTLVWDGGTDTQSAYHKWYANNKVYTYKGPENEFAEYQLKIDFFNDFIGYFKTTKAHVIYICHESQKFETGKLRPLLTGQFCDQLVSHFTDWFRQHNDSKPKDLTPAEDVLKKWRMNKEEFKEMCNTFPGETIYYWQTEGDALFDAKASSLVNCPRFIPANSKAFLKYCRNAS